MTVLPGMDELGNLLWIADHVDGGDYDVIVVDAAPTGETLRLLSMPEASRWWVERIAPIGKRVSRLGGPILQKVIGIPVPQEEVFLAAERLLGRLDHLHPTKRATMAAGTASASAHRVMRWMALSANS